MIRRIIGAPVEFRRVGRVAEGAPLLREYGVNSSIEGSNPSLSAILNGVDFRNCIDRIVKKTENSRLDFAHVAQLDRVPGYEPGGRRFESFHARHTIRRGPAIAGPFLLHARSADSNLRHQTLFDKRRRRADRPQADNPSMRAIRFEGARQSPGFFCCTQGRRIRTSDIEPCSTSAGGAQIGRRPISFHPGDPKRGIMLMPGLYPPRPRLKNLKRRPPHADQPFHRPAAAECKLRPGATATAAGSLH